MKTRLAILTLCTIFSLRLFAQTEGLQPVPSTEKQDSLIEVATALHDEGKYDEAIDLYKKVLQENPANVTALYEITFSYFAKGDHDNSIKYSSEGMKYKSKLLPLFYMNMGSSLDIQGKIDEAIKVYEDGISIQPNHYLLRYNLALTLFKKQEYDKVLGSLHYGLKLNASHPSSNLLLGNTYMTLGKGVPAILAFMRFLVLEPQTGRSSNAVNNLEQILSSYVTRKDSMNINITVNTDSDAVSGDLNALETGIALAHATQFIGNDVSKTVKIPEIKKSEIQFRVEEFQSLFNIMSELSEKKKHSGFVWEYYAPYFIDLQKQGHTEAFIYYIYNCSGQEEVKNWMAQNKNKVRDFMTWNKSYRW